MAKIVSLPRSSLVLHLSHKTYVKAKSQTYHRQLCFSLCSLVPKLPDLFNVAREKRGSLVKLITCVTSGGTNFHIWHNSKLAGSRDGISHRKLEFFDLKGCESASGGHSVRSPCVENCNLHSNSIVPTSKSVPPWAWTQSSYHANHSFRLIAKGLIHSQL